MGLSVSTGWAGSAPPLPPVYHYHVQLITALSKRNENRKVATV
jgi:hypothetical protein